MKFLFFLVFTGVIHAQGIRFIYNYKSISDTLNKNNVVSEIMILEIDTKQKKSVFSSLKKIQSDSNMVANVAKGIYLFPDSSMKTQYVIEKNTEKKETFFYTQNHSLIPVSKVEDKRQINWNILNEKKEILSYPTQKATTSFGGRTWTAWFTTSIPFSEGPYKFYGLPGLILKIYDSTNSHSYELIGVEKINSNSYKLLNDTSYISSKKISLDDYVRTIKNYQKDPMQNIRQKVFKGEILFENDQQKITYLRENEIKLKKEVSQNNNPIEK